MAKKTQEERILDYIKEFGSITAREAYLDLGIMRLAARIADLTEKGYDFDRTMVTDKNRYGETTRFARYSLKKER